MKKNYLLYAITLIVVAIVMYHATYFFFWLSDDIVKHYAGVLLLVFLFVSVPLYCIFRKSSFRLWVNAFIIGWLVGSLYALGPSMLNLGVQYYDGLVIRRTDLTSILKNSTCGLVDKWGRTIIENNDNDFYYIDRYTIVGLENYKSGDQWHIDFHLYKDFVLTKTIRIKTYVDSGAEDDSYTIGNFIEKRFGHPVMSYRNFKDNEYFLNVWLVEEVIEIVNYRDTSDDVKMSDKASRYDDNDNYDDDHVRNEPIRRDPVPVQEWVPCTGCNGSGKCNNCNGTGQNLYSTNYMECIGCGGSGRCEFCAGQGGHYETRFR